MNWTKEQQQAIDQRNKNILVAAAAGSGKTAVLVERIKKLIIEDGVPIDRMLIVTFTNAAASEMKEKIRKAINDSIDLDPENSKMLKEQLALLPRANISTFHSFALDVIRNFFYLSDVEPGFSICDEAQGTIIREDAMDLLLESRFAQAEDEFFDFLNWYSSDRNQNKIRNIISNSYRVLQALPHPWQWLDNKINDLNRDYDQFVHSRTMDFIWDFIEESTDEAADMSYQAMNILADNGLERMANMIKEEWAFYEELKEKSKNHDFEGVNLCFNTFPKITLRARKDEKDIYEEIKPLVKACRDQASGYIKDINNIFFCQPLEEQIEEMNKTYPKALTLESLLHEFDQLFKEGKKNKNLVDFNDIEHYCLDILEHPEAAKHYMEKFEYIFIDEYQDTNVLQEEIISKIKRDNNLFMVGDIKQSIYKFRLAEPSIFKKKYDYYGSISEEKSTKIDLNRNYRSKSEILKEINLIFNELMDDYNEDAMLYPGLDYSGECNYIPELKIVDIGTASDADEEIANLKAAEIEALEVGRLIEQNLGRTYFDSKAGVEKHIRPRDIVILMRSIKNQAETFYNILKEKKIDAYIDDNEGYFDTIEINVFMNLLSVIDNKHQDVPLISALHSEIFGFSAEELAIVRTEHKENSYTEAFVWYCENGRNINLKEKCKASLDLIEKWKSMSRAMPLPQFVWKLLLETGYYVIMGTMPGGAQRQANLRALVDKAEKFSDGGQVSLYSFMKYIDAVKTRKVTMGQVKMVGENADIVRIMSIHKSKGLEFPMVIVSGLGKRLNYTKGGDAVTIHKDIGLGMTLASFEEHWSKQTLLQRLINKQVHKEEVQEEVRVLYVALTRAKDILYMSGTVRNEEKYREKIQCGIKGEGTYLDMIMNVSKRDFINCQLLSRILDESEYIQNPIGRDVYEGEISESRRADVLRRLNFKYPYTRDVLIKSKYSVSELNRNTKINDTEELVLTTPKFRQGEKAMTAAEKGTVYHSFMERLDFVKVASEGIEYVKAQAEKYVLDGIFLREEVKAIKLEKLLKFFQTDIGRRCVKAAETGMLRRETPFTLIEDYMGENIMVQGIIDCYFQEENELVLVDYKTNWIDPSKPLEEEKTRLAKTYYKQMEIYAKALEKATGKRVKECMLYLLDAETKIEIIGEKR